MKTTQRLNYRLNLVFIHWWIFFSLCLWNSSAFKSAGWLDELDECNLCMCYYYVMPIFLSSKPIRNSDADKLHNRFRIGPIPKTLVTSLINYHYLRTIYAHEDTIHAYAQILVYFYISIYESLYGESKHTQFILSSFLMIVFSSARLVAL